MEKQEFQDKVQKVADILGYTMILPEEQFIKQATLIQDNIKINIRNGGYQQVNKIHISGSYPHDCHGGINYHGLKNSAINCAATKTPEQIARDIQKRFLPDYMEDMKKIINTNENVQQYADARYETIKTIADLLGVSPQQDHKNEYSIPTWNVLKGLHGLEVDYYGRVDLKLELTPDQAVQVLTLLKTFGKVA